MCGDSEEEQPMFIYGTVGQRVPQGHPLRPVRAVAHEALRAVPGI
jgi:hypothetical protein